MLVAYSIFVTIIVIAIIGYLIYEHKTRHIGDSKFNYELTEKMNNNLKVYNKELGQLIRQMHTIRIHILDVTKELDIENVLGDCEVKFEGGEVDNEE